MEQVSEVCRKCGAALPAGAALCPACEVPTAELLNILPVIRGYAFRRLLGAGGMGAVYLAEDLTLGRPVAIKLISEEIAQSPEARARLLREARSMATVEHPNIVRVYAFGEAEDVAYVIMEYVEGTVLSERVRREGALTYRESLQIARQVVEALEAAWEKRIVHRDIKPSNILLDRRGRVLVADFGLAKPLPLVGKGPALTPLTETTSVMGTPQYLSPERAQGLPEDFRADLYSLGVVLFEMLTGSPPFQGSTSYAIASKHLHETIPPMGEKRKDLPRSAQELVDWLTKKNPAERPESHRQLLDRIDEYIKAPAMLVSQFDLPSGETGAESIPDNMVPAWELELPPELPKPTLAPLRPPTGPVTPAPPPPPPAATPVRPAFSPSAGMTPTAPAAAIPTPVRPPSTPAFPLTPPAPAALQTPAAPPAPAFTPPIPARPTSGAFAAGAPTGETIPIDCPGCGRRHQIPVSRYPEAGGRFPCPGCQAPIQFPPRAHAISPAAAAPPPITPMRRPTTGATPLPPAAPPRPTGTTPTPAAAAVTAPAPKPPAAPPAASRFTAPPPRKRSGGFALSRRNLILAGAGGAAVLAIVLFFALRSPSGREETPAPAPPPEAPAAPAAKSAAASAAPAAGTVVDSRVYREFTARIVKPEGAGAQTLEIARGSQVLASLSGARFAIGTLNARGEPVEATEMGKEITGEGVGNLVVSEWTGKGNCCITYHVYDLGTTLREVGALATDNTKSEFRDVDGDGRLELVTTDGTFAGWRGLPATIRPDVILRFEDGRYRLAVSLMQKDAPDAGQLADMAARIRRAPAWRQGKEPPELAREMLDLIYAGQAFLAWRFCADAWPPDRQGRSQFLEEFRARLSSSPYGEAVKAMNTNINNG